LRPVEAADGVSRFTEILLVSPLADGNTWVIMRDFGYEVGAEGSGDRVDVAIGFQTDFATVPRPLWIVLPKWGRYGNAAVIHDWLYWKQDRPRATVDGLFFEAMGVLGVGAAASYTLYWGVRLVGWLAWDRKRALGNTQGVPAEAPRFHGTEDGRWDYRITIVWKNAAAPHEPFPEAELKRLFPDQDTFRREEQRRFEILAAHWDLPVVTVDLSRP